MIVFGEQEQAVKMSDMTFFDISWSCFAKTYKSKQQNRGRRVKKKCVQGVYLAESLLKHCCSSSEIKRDPDFHTKGRRAVKVFKR